MVNGNNTLFLVLVLFGVGCLLVQQKPQILPFYALYDLLKSHKLLRLSKKIFDVKLKM